MRIRLLLGLILFLLTAVGVAGRHPANIPSARAKIDLDGKLSLRVRFDILAFVVDQSPFEVGDGPMNALLDGPAADLQARLKEAQGRFLKNLRLIGDNGPGVVDAVSFPSAADIHDLVDQVDGIRLPVMMTVDVSAHFPKGVRTTAFRFPDVLGTVVLTTELPYVEPISEPVDPGTSSTAVRIPTAAETKATAATMLASHDAPSAVKPAPKPLTPPQKAPAATSNAAKKPSPPVSSAPQEESSPAKVEVKPPTPADKQTATPASPATPSVPSEPAAAPAQPGISLFSSFPRYVKMGYTHILPEGLDHILFVLGLFLLSRRAKDLIKQITAFTIAHSITLALALYGVVRLPSQIVEPVIALSIAFVAIENIFTTEVKAWRPYVVFAFGLVHGLGFAGALQDAGLSRQDMLPALVGFNIGVELGQLSVVALAWILVARFQKSPRYRPVFAIPASIAIALVAVFWTVQRVM